MDTGTPATGAFGALLYGLRRRAGLSQEELAHAAGVSVRALSYMERGRSRGPQRRTVQALAEALGLDPEGARELEHTRAWAARAGPAPRRPRPPPQDRTRPRGPPRRICCRARRAASTGGRRSSPPCPGPPRARRPSAWWSGPPGSGRRPSYCTGPTRAVPDSPKGRSTPTCAGSVTPASPP
ncbi:hypothetical protein VR44_38325 [Streptomyces katrae]|uniref:HTH cro/C1-type domain-containing protein n=1 Tax=Streptomyces katrae TaxID=68223 RepID=A0A0F4IL06_9ACTN|nr:hypothetical protein VR44_38325 [Streptomyces katrae]